MSAPCLVCLYTLHNFCRKIILKFVQFISPETIDIYLNLWYNYYSKREEIKTMTIAQSIQYAVDVALGDKARANIVKGA